MLIVAGIAALAAFALGGAALAGATQGAEEDADEQSFSGSGAEQARAAALKEAGGGTVTGLERDPEGARTYEVEVRKPDGSVVDIELDQAFKVLAVDGDSDGANENEANEKNEGNDSDD